MKKSSLVLPFVLVLLAAGSAVATKASATKGRLFQAAYERTAPNECSPITVDDDCNPSGLNTCVAGKTIVQNGPTACNVELHKP